MLLAAATVCVIERRFPAAAGWCAAAAVLSAAGLLHSYRWTPGDTAVSLTPAWEWAAAYAVMAVVFLGARWVTEAGEEH